MIVRLDPRPPLVWRSPTSLQIGVDPVRAVLPHVDDGVVRVIGALGTGVTRDGLEVVADRAGVAPARVDELLDALAPALVEPNQPPAPSHSPIVVTGAGTGASRIAAVLAESGRTVRSGVTAARALPRASPRAIALLVTQHVVGPREHHRWLRRDTPHLPVIFSEHGVVVGPLVVPGVTACLGCVSLHRTDDDPAWPAISTQLWGRSAAAESPLLATRAALEVIDLLEQHDADTEAGGGASAAKGAVSIRIDAFSGERKESRTTPHPRCGCRDVGH